MTAVIPAGKPRRILEVGPGTGAFTEAILEQLEDGDALHLVELNETFCAALEQSVLSPHRVARPGVELVLHNASIADVDLEGAYDAIVCGLPFNNFTPSLAATIFDSMLRRLGPGGELAYFEYLGIRPLRRLLGPRSWRAVRDHAAADAARSDQWGRSTTIVCWNLPPARVVRLGSRQVG